IDDEALRTFPKLTLVSNRFSTRLPDGTYTWNIRCHTHAGEEIQSTPRTFTVAITEQPDPLYLYASAGSYYVIPVGDDFEELRTGSKELPHARPRDTIELYHTHNGTPTNHNVSLYIRNLLSRPPHRRTLHPL
ncbi:MAG: hypothetical protein HC945_04235, partial [Nitrosarchaeum sp.]|nr:hypothetical protein [Nitrosarchaeum sp.]